MAVFLVIVRSTIRKAYDLKLAFVKKSGSLMVSSAF